MKRKLTNTYCLASFVVLLLGLLITSEPVLKSAMTSSVTLSYNGSIAHETWDWKDEFTDRNSRWRWSSNNVGGGYKICPTTVDGYSACQLVIPASASSFAHSDNCLTSGWLVNFVEGLTLTVEARLKFTFNLTARTGNAGFGFWHPSQGRTLWFLGCSPESQSDLVGMRAMACNPAPNFFFNTLVTDVIPGYDMTQWHIYRIEYSPSGIVLKIDGVVIGSSSQLPTGQMELVTWNDNGIVKGYGEVGYVDIPTELSTIIDYIAYRES